MALRLYNTLTRRKEPFEPLDPKRVRMYVCGPTVYDYAHIGNARPVVVFDVLYRLLILKYGKSKVSYVRNITDVDDKIINAAKSRNESVHFLSRRMEKIFHEDAKALLALKPTHQPQARRYIKQMIQFIEGLILKGHAYVADGHVLFSTDTMEDYGALSGHSQDELEAGARVEVASFKRNPLDFVLWKPSKPGEQEWPSPWGRGRPGWHIECSTMSERLLGVTFDIHGGGQDLIFPHHENEIAQTRCLFGTPFMAKYWVHNGYVTVEGKKMSKSLGNFYTVRDLLHEFPGEAIRLLLLKTHYRQPLDFTRSRLSEAKTELDRWYRALQSLSDVAPEPVTEPLAAEQPLDAITADLDDDLNTPLAIARLHTLAQYALNPSSRSYRDTGAPISVRRGQVKYRLLQSAELLGVLASDPEVWFKGDTAADDVAKIKRLMAWREAARKARDFAEADRIRDDLRAMGVELEDRPDGTTDWRRAG